MKPISTRPPTVMMTDHAHQRWLERANRRPHKPTALAAKVEQRLYSYLRTSGVETAGLAVILDMGGGICAVLELTEIGWVTKTFLLEPDRSNGKLIGEWTI